MKKLSKRQPHFRELASTLYARSEGSPLFLTELIRDVRESGTAADLRNALPLGLKEIVASRLSRLSESSRSLAEMAAIVGNAFDVDLLRELSGWSEDRVIGGLDELLDRHLIREAIPGERGDYTFSHQLIEGAIYSEAGERNLKRRHRRVAVAMEEMYGDRLDDFAHRIAYHFERGTEPSRAARYFEHAASLALEVFAYEEAVARATRGLELTTDAPARANLLLLRERAHARLGNGEARRRDVDEVSRSD